MFIIVTFCFELTKLKGKLFLSDRKGVPCLIFISIIDK